MPRDSSRRSSSAPVRPSATLASCALQLGQLGRHRRLGGAQIQHQRHQPLLGTVVQVAFDPPAGLVAGGHDPRPRGGQLLAALLQRAGHGVEAALQHPDLADAALGHARPEVAAGEPAGHGGRPADRLHDRPGQVAGEQGDEQDRPAETDPPRRRWRRSAAASERRSRAAARPRSARHEAVELGPDGVHAPPALVGRGHRPRRGRVPPGGGHQRDRVVPQVGPGRLDDASGPLLLFGVVAHQPLQGGGLPGEGDLGAPATAPGSAPGW